MKLWLYKEQTPTYLTVKLHCEEHSSYTYVGDLNEEEIKQLLLQFDPTIDTQKNLKLLSYYGYLHLFVLKK